MNSRSEVNEATLPQQPIDAPAASAGEGRLSSDQNPTIDHDSTPTSPGAGLHVRCPHCHNPIELVPDAELESIACPSCGSDFSLVSDDQATRTTAPVTQVGHFKLVDRVGMGAFGAVWKAHDTRLDRTVAIKIPRKGQFDERQEKAFLREAQNAAQLHHAGIVPVHEVGRDGDTLFIVSDFIRGLTLADWLTGQQLTPRESAELCIKIAEALDHAHQHGVVHRDLKPGNIMLDEEGAPHLMDFGLAKRDAAEVTMSLDGQIIGTPAYMSPEQAEGDGHTADARADVYSLGVILFQLVTGELPFRGNARMLIHQVLHDEPPSPRKLNSAVPRDVETIILKCLAKEPDRRYASAGDVAADLSRWLRNEPVLAKPAGVVEKAWKWVRRNPAPAASVAVVVLSLAAVAGTALGSSIRDRARVAQLQDAQKQTEQALATAEEATQQALASAERESASAERERAAAELAKRAEERAKAERDQTRELINFQAAEHALEDGDLGEAFARLQSADAIAPRWEYGSFYSQIVREARKWFAPIYRVELDRPPSIARVVLPKNRGSLEAGDAWLLTADSRGLEMRRLEDERLIARLPIGADPAGGSPALTSRVTSAVVVAPAAPDAPPRVAITTSKDGLLVLSAPDLQLVARGPDGFRATRVHAASAAPRLLAVSGKTVSVLDADTGEALAEASFPEFDRVETTAISPDGRTVCVGPFSVENKPVAWRWEEDKRTEVARTMQQFAFADNGALVGKYAWATSRAESRYYAIDVNRGRVAAQSAIGVGDVGSRGDFMGWHAAGALGVARRSPDGVALGVVADDFSDESQTGAPRDTAVAVRASDLKPQSYDSQAKATRQTIDGAAQQATVLDFDPACFAVVVARGREVEVFGPQHAMRWMLNAPKDDDDTPTEYRLLSLSADCFLWCCAQRGESLWTASTTHLTRRKVAPTTAGLRVSAYVRPGKPYGLDLAGKYERVVALASNGSGERLWALWEGADTFLHTQRPDSKDLGVAFYDMTKPRQKTKGYGEVAEASAQFRLARHPSGGARVVREFFVSCSEETIVVANERVIACYDAQTGALKHELPSTHSFAVSPDHRYLVGASWREEMPAGVWDVDSGEKIMETDCQGKVVKMAFGADSAVLHVGWKGGRLAAYDLRSGTELRSLATPVAPVRMIPGATRFVGFVPASGPMGDLVLADVEDGRPVSTLAEGVHVLTKCFCNQDGDALSIVNKSTVDIVPRITSETAANLLDSLDPLCKEAWRRTLANRDYPAAKDADTPNK